MKNKKIIIILMLFIVSIFMFMPKVNAGGMKWDISIGAENPDDEIDATEGKIKKGKYAESDEKTELLFESDDFNKYIEEVNKYLPDGVTLKANTNKTYDIYMNNVKFSNYLSFYGAWSGNLYLSGKNELNSLQLVGKCDEFNIIGDNFDTTIIKKISLSIDHNMKTTFKDCNIKVEKECDINLGKAINVEGNIRLELPPKAEINYYGTSEREAFINFIGEQYNSKYETGEINSWSKYCSTEPIIIKNYNDVELLEQSVEKIKSGEKLTFRFDEKIEKFEKLYINGKLLKKDVDYTIKSGSTIVELSEEYTKTLKIGKYEVKAMFTKGVGTANFEILEQKKIEEPQIEESKKEETKKENTQTEKKELDNTPKTGVTTYYASYYTVLGIIAIIIISGTILKMKK